MRYMGIYKEEPMVPKDKWEITQKYEVITQSGQSLVVHSDLDSAVRDAAELTNARILVTTRVKVDDTLSVESKTDLYIGRILADGHDTFGPYRVYTINPDRTVELVGTVSPETGELIRKTNLSRRLGLIYKK